MGSPKRCRNRKPGCPEVPGPKPRAIKFQGLTSSRRLTTSRLDQDTRKLFGGQGTWTAAELAAKGFLRKSAVTFFTGFFQADNRERPASSAIT